MLQGYLIEKYSDMQSAYTCQRLQEAAARLDIRLEIIGVHDVVILEDGPYFKGKKLTSCDFVINRYKWGYVKQEISNLAKRQYNTQQAFETYVNKYLQLKNISSEAFLKPEYCLATAQKGYEALAQMLGARFVAKGLENSQGSEVFLITGQKELDALTESYDSEKEWLFETFIEESFGRDIRFYSVRGQVIACMTRESQGDFRANVALGANVKPYKVTPQIRQAAKDIYEQTGLDFLGIDLLFGNDKPYFCEINVMPGIEGIEKATGVNVAEKIMETIAGDFYNEQN